MRKVENSKFRSNFFADLIKNKAKNVRLVKKILIFAAVKQKNTYYLSLVPFE